MGACFFELSVGKFALCGECTIGYAEAITDRPRRHILNGVAAVETGGKQLSAGQLYLIFEPHHKFKKRKRLLLFPLFGPPTDDKSELSSLEKELAIQIESKLETIA